MKCPRRKNWCKNQSNQLQVFSAIRYHSLVIERENLPDCFEITAWTEDGTIMGLRHREFPVEGIQFHPESFMTEGGKKILGNFLERRSGS